jgi:hypothetical protein
VDHLANGLTLLGENLRYDYYKSNDVPLSNTLPTLFTVLTMLHRYLMVWMHYSQWVFSYELPVHSWALPCVVVLAYSPAVIRM